MKSFKRIIPFIIALMMLFVIPLAACGSCSSCKDKENNVVEEEAKKTLQSITVEGAKEQFYYNEDFATDGLVVTATFKQPNVEETEEVVLTAEEYTVDSSKFDKSNIGEYKITVSYTFEGQTKSADYTVRVINGKEGLSVTLAEGVSATIKVASADAKTEIDASKIVVKQINLDGTVGDVITGYTTSLYNGQTEIELTAGKATVGVGVYQIWVEKQSEIHTGYMLRAFVIITVEVGA